MASLNAWFLRTKMYIAGNPDAENNSNTDLALCSLANHMTDFLNHIWFMNLAFPTTCF